MRHFETLGSLLFRNTVKSLDMKINDSISARRTLVLAMDWHLFQLCRL